MIKYQESTSEIIFKDLSELDKKKEEIIPNKLKNDTRKNQPDITFRNEKGIKDKKVICIQYIHPIDILANTAFFLIINYFVIQKLTYYSIYLSIVYGFLFLMCYRFFLWWYVPTRLLFGVQALEKITWRWDIIHVRIHRYSLNSKTIVLIYPYPSDLITIYYPVIFSLYSFTLFRNFSWVIIILSIIVTGILKEAKRKLITHHWFEKCEYVEIYDKRNVL